MTPDYIVIHHSLTQDSETVSWGAIRDWHTGRNPVSPLRWTDIGYQFGVELVGDHFEVLMGRRPDQVGAHTKELLMNRRSIGVVLVGNFDLASPPQRQWDKAVWLVQWLASVYSIPSHKVVGHREVGLMAGYDWRLGQYKSCPGRHFDMDQFRSRL